MYVPFLVSNNVKDFNNWALKLSQMMQRNTIQLALKNNPIVIQKNERKTCVAPKVKLKMKVFWWLYNIRAHVPQPPL
jgi:hypothetical protein